MMCVEFLHSKCLRTVKYPSTTHICTHTTVADHVLQRISAVL